MNKSVIIGIDMGGTKISASLVQQGVTTNIISKKINPESSANELLQELYILIDQLFNKNVTAIGIGIPGLVIKGIAYDVYNIPTWKEVPLQQLLEKRYNIPVCVENDSNCFALGEFYFGKGKGYDSMIGVTIGSGLGTGIIINKKIYSGKTCGAGEFGMIPYLDKFYEYYASGQFFQNIYGISGELVFQKAREGKEDAIKMYEAFGIHLGNAIKTILYALDPSLIVLGGSVKNAFSFFEKTMWKQIQTFELKKGLEGLQIEVSASDNSAISGAAALHYNQ